MRRSRKRGCVHYESAGAGAPVVCLVTAPVERPASGTRSWKDWPTCACNRPTAGTRPVGRRSAREHPGVRSPSSRASSTPCPWGASVLAGTRWGALSLRVRAHVPERVDGLILSGPAPVPSPARLLELLATDYPKAEPADADGGPRRPRPHSGHRWIVRCRQSPRRGPGDLRACDAFDVMTRIDTFALRPSRSVAEEDRLTPPKYSRLFGERIAAARRRRAGLGHYVQVEQVRGTTAHCVNSWQSCAVVEEFPT